MSTNDHSFKWFAEHGFFQTVNSHLVELARIKPGHKIVDLACGTGAATKMILEHLKGAKDSLVIGIDASTTSLREAIIQVGNVRDVAVEFVYGRVEALSDMVKDKVDGVIFCNGIHYISDKENLLKQIVNSLKPGGIFAFNTSFFQGAHLSDTEQYYRRWMMKSIRNLKTNYGLMPKTNKVESRRQLTPQQYTELLENNGFSILTQHIRATEVPLQGWVDISRFEDFAAGALPGIPIEHASQALREGAEETFKELGIDSVPRNWLSIVAIKS